MKSRLTIFFLGFLLGLTPGYFLGQEQYRSELEAGFVKIAGKVDAKLREWVRRAVNRITPATNEVSPQPTTRPRPLPSKPASGEDFVESGAYIRESIRLRDTQARRESGSANQVIVSGVVKNAGSRTLKAIEVVIFFVGQEGIVYEAKAAVVHGRPLESQEERAFSVPVPEVPAQWSDGKVRVAVTDVAFAP